MTKGKPRTWFLAVTILVSSLTGCTDLTAVRDWSNTSLEASQFNEIVATYVDTPERLQRYDTQDEATRAGWQKQRVVREAQAEALQSLLALVSDYMATLSTLASDSVIDFSEEASAYTTSLQNLNRVAGDSIPNDTIGAVGSLVQTMADAALDLWRANEVKKIIAEANQPLQSILAGELRSIVREDFRRDLVIEESFLDAHFKSLIRHPDSSPAAQAALNEWFVLRKLENQRRIAAVDAYLGILDDISKGHQKLYDNRGELDAQILVKELYTLVKSMRKNITVILQA